jgi:hypothetical protein
VSPPSVLRITPPHRVHCVGAVCCVFLLSLFSIYQRTLIFIPSEYYIPPSPLPSLTHTLPHHSLPHCPSLQTSLQNVTACQDGRNSSTACGGTSEQVLNPNERSPPLASWRSQNSSMRLDTVISPSRSSLGQLRKNSGLRGSTIQRKSLVYAARKPYDATTQRWQALINRFEKEVRGVAPASGKVR